ncbi:hypothetical protein [Thermococcus sp.]|uniref:hypothetical protein n=1 Tax=Thermococcus sp. TaxID=35749 RepID=UPI00262384CB|nr:hypothetical protein [Thermococcus sp.]
MRGEEEPIKELLKDEEIPSNTSPFLGPFGDTLNGVILGSHNLGNVGELKGGARRIIKLQIHNRGVHPNRDTNIRGINTEKTAKTDVTSGNVHNEAIPIESGTRVNELQELTSSPKKLLPFLQQYGTLLLRKTPPLKPPLNVKETPLKLVEIHPNFSLRLKLKTLKPTSHGPIERVDLQSGGYRETTPTL